MWHIPKLKTELKQIILSSSANTLKLTQKSPNRYESFIDIHKSCNKALPNQIINYKHAILLHKTYNSMDWIELNFTQTFTSRQSYFNSIKSSNYKVGDNLISTRLSILNHKIPLNDLNLSLDSFKVKYKSVFL